MKKPVISVIIPCYNQGLYLEEAIKSIKNQTFKEYEIIVVNDGSTDIDTISKLDQLKAKYSDVKFIDQKNEGVASARNNGVNISSGEFIFPLDSDDLIAPTMLEKCLKEMRKNEELGFVYTYTELFGNENERIARSEYNFYDLLQMNFIVVSSLIRKKFFEEVGGFDENPENLYEDWELFIKLGKHGRFGKLIREPLFFYRKHGVSRVEKAIVMHKKSLNYIKERHSDLYSHKRMAEIKKEWKYFRFMVIVKDGFIRIYFSIKFKLEAAGVFNGRNWKKYHIMMIPRFIPIGFKKKINNLLGRDLLDVGYFGKKN